MARNTDGLVTKLTYTRGVDNRNHETKVAPGFARAADNVDIDPDGVVSTREGYALFAALPGAHSLWGDEAFPFYAFVADSTSLYLFATDGGLTPIASNLAGSDVHYAAMGGRIHWSNGVQTGAVAADGTPQTWGVETPAPTFVLSLAPTGGLHAGRYGVTMTFISDTREESGAPDPVYIDVPEGGGILVNAVPTASSLAVTTARIYRTETNSPDFLYAQSTTPGMAQYLLGAQLLGRPLTTLFKDAFPPAKYLLAKAGRIFGALGRQLVWSDALYYGLTDASSNSITFPHPITMIAAPESPQFVVYIGTAQKVYMLAGDSIATATRTTVSNYGAIPGSFAMISAEEAAIQGVDTDVPFWIGGDGVPYAGLVTGIQPLSKNFVYPIYDKAAATFLQENGRSRYIVSGQGGRSSGLTASDSVVATVFNNGGGA